MLAWAMPRCWRAHWHLHFGAACKQNQRAPARSVQRYTKAEVGMIPNRPGVPGQAIFHASHQLLRRGEWPITGIKRSAQGAKQTC
jgi:hypothetical protein